MTVFVGELQRQLRKDVKVIFGLETHDQDDLLTDLLILSPRQLQRRCMEAHLQGGPGCTEEDAHFFVDLFFR